MPKRIDISSVMIIGAGPIVPPLPPPLWGRVGVGGVHLEPFALTMAGWHRQTPSACAKIPPKPSAVFGVHCAPSRSAAFDFAVKRLSVLSSPTSFVSRRDWSSNSTAATMLFKLTRTRPVPDGLRPKAFGSCVSGTTMSSETPTGWSKPYATRSMTPLPDPPPQGGRGQGFRSPAYDALTKLIGGG